VTDLLPIDLQDMIATVRRELHLRKAVYPRWVGDGKMQQSRADREIEVMQAVLDYLTKQREAEKT
jgi:hypothetical protein